LAKNFNIKVKNSQLAAMLKQKDAKAKEISSEPKKGGEQSTSIPSHAPAEEKKKILRKATAGPTFQASEKVEETMEKQELFEEIISDDLDQEVLENATTQELENTIAVEEVPEILPVKEDLEETLKEEKIEEKAQSLSPEELRRKEMLKPIEERRLLPQDKYKRPAMIRSTPSSQEKSFPAKKAPFEKREPSKIPKLGEIPPAKPIFPSREKKVDEKKIEEKKVEDKKKKGMDSYKRQAFSRVFDSRSTLSTEENWKRRKDKKSKTVISSENIVRPKSISVKIPITVKELASELKIKASEVIQKLFLAGYPITINDILEDEVTIELIGNEFDCQIKIDRVLEDKLQITDKTLKEEIKGTDHENLAKRPPIVTVMGHVDHGKTSIIDAFRNSSLTSGEAGAITQHIGAFVCNTDHGSFSVIDTPGHEAFTAIRSRGATITDIIVLVIAGDEGIKTQTEEAINKAKEAGVPILVAINKMDKSGFNAENIYKQLADHNLLPEAWGGDVITVNCSAKTKEGIAELAEMIALQTDVLELRSNPNARARGMVLESELHQGLGVTATLLVLNGTLKTGDAVVFEHEWGKTKTMQNEFGKIITQAPPSTPVKVTGLSGVPPAGNEFIVVGSEKEAKDIVSQRKSMHRQIQLKKVKARGAQSMLDQRVENMSKKTLNVIIKADVGGSLEALKDSLMKIDTSKVIIHFVQYEVGQISESDIDLAHASNSIILGFHTKVEKHAEGMVKQKKVKIILHDIIYHMIDEVKAEMQKLLDKVRHEEHVATAKVTTIFTSSKLGNIAGSIITHGVFKRSYLARLKRDGKTLYEGPISSLKRMHDDVKEVKKDTECGILLTGFNDFKPGDEIEGYEISYLEQEL
jgi:translation initiation factor IF-2